jgi:hypothetical protein
VGGVEDHACGGGFGARFLEDDLGVGMTIGAGSFAMNWC